jgi:tyrosyl-tRNA synthetase
MKQMKQKVQEILSRGVEEIHIRESLEKKLLSDKKLRIKHGIDPTGPKIHIGRAATLWKLREFQDLGHQIVLIIGDYTAQIGDPSDKLAKRPFLSEEQVKENMKSYEKQLGKILDMGKVELRYNSEWLAKLTPRELDKLADLFSVQQMIARRNFKERWEKGEEISIRELHYPLYQGYDSVAVKADVEIGGSDQLFNLLAGRKIQEAYNQSPQDILTTKMILGTDGRKMSTSWGNVINIIDEPEDMYGKVMSIIDELIIDYFTLCTRLPLEKIEEFERELKSGKNPRDIKMILAYEIVKLYHGEEKAKEAQKNFVKIFQKKEAPEEIPTKKVRSTVLFEILVETGLASTKSEARRLIEQGGIKVDNKVIKDIYFKPKIAKKGVLIQKGKRFFIKVIPFE